MACCPGLDVVVGFNFICADREQSFLMPPDMREWLPEDHLAFTVLDAVERFDLSAFESSYRADGHGRAAYDPALMVALLLFAYCDGVSSSREVERRCERDVAYRVVAGNQRPDHATLARFRNRHRDALDGLFVQVLRLCAEAGMVRVGLVALDGTKLAANASSSGNRTAQQLDDQIAKQVEQMLAEAQERDAAEDAEYGAARGDEAPAGMRDRERRIDRLRAAKARLDAEAEAAQAAQDQRRRDYEQRRARGEKVGAPPGETPPKGGRRGERRTNLVDPDSRVMKSRQGVNGWTQGYNGQILVGSGQIILARTLVNDPTDYGSLYPMLAAARANLDAIGYGGPEHRMRALVADSGYGGKANLKPESTCKSEPILLIATNSGRHKSGAKKATDDDGQTKPFKDKALNTMQRRLDTPAGRSLFRRRAHMVEPVFAQTKNRLGHRLRQRGLDAVKAEWNLIATSHNLLKWHQRTAHAGC